ncbi:riboflavin biosynthesis protein PYRD, chloroplastic isoform X2 [Impatiens glandulifera]|nr:riboflavin biosynthesis protein PYRD, chloroplastic isoform X2 [Impatiens glandulifera]
MRDDGFYIRRCVELARKAIGRTSPNPMVGCVIVKDGEIVGEGFHPKAGQPHAEVFALRDAGDLAVGSTAYVSLEPCNHYGRTPPCTEALIKADVKKVVVGMVDPNPIVASKGVDRLRAAGIEVNVAVEEELCKKLNEAYIHQMLTGKPFVAIRYTLSVNGHFLNKLGEEVAQTGGYYSKLLQEYDAILCSSSLIKEDHLLPESAEPEANQPFQIVVAKEGSSETDERRVVLDQTSLDSILDLCKSRGLCSLLVDLRGNVVGLEEIVKEGLEKNLFQKVIVEVLPIWDEEVKGGNFSIVLNDLNLKLGLKSLTSSEISGKSVLLEGYF